MKKLLPLFILLAFILADCAPAPQATAVILPTQTATATATAEPTDIPATPTEVKPKAGDTRVNEKGLTEEYVQFKTKEGEVGYEGYVVSLTPPEGIPVLDGIRFKTVGPIKLFADPKTISDQKISFTHAKLLKDTWWENKFIGTVLDKLIFRITGKKAITDQNENHTYNSGFFDSNPNTSGLHIKWNGTDETVKEGNIGIDEKVGISCIYMPWGNDMQVQDNGGSAEFANGKGNVFRDATNKDLFWVKFVGIDKNGGGMCLISSDKPFQDLSPKQQRMMLLYQIANILRTDDQTTPGYSTDLDYFLDLAGEDTPPYIAIQKTSLTPVPTPTP